MPCLISQLNSTLGRKCYFSAIGRKTHGPILKHFTIVNFAHENITISKFVSSVSALIGIPCSVELIPIGEIHNAVAMFNFCPPIENFGTDFPDFPDIFDAILVFNGGAFGFG